MTIQTVDQTRRKFLGGSALVLSGIAAGGAFMSRTASSQSAAVKTAGRNRALVAYFSRSGNTRLIAGKVRRDLDADLFEIEPSERDPEDY